jgi:exopolysaccharide biosynthesis polyprenyl glycosylphosphotransferase
MTTSPFSLSYAPGPHADFIAVRRGLRMLNDVFLIFVAFGVALSARMTVLRLFNLDFNGLPETRNAEVDFFYLALYVSCYLWVAYHYGLYSLKPAHNVIHEMRLVLQACATAGLVLCGAVHMCRGIEMSRTVFVVLVAVSSLALCLRHWAAPALHLRTHHKSSGRTVAIVGTNQFSFVMSDHLRKNPQLAYGFLGFIRFPGSTQGAGVTEGSILGELSEIDDLKKKHFIDEILVTEYCPEEQAMDLIDRASVLGIDVRAVSGFYPQLTVNAPVEYLGYFPVTSLHHTKSREIALVFKRAADIVLSSMALLAASIPMALVAIAIKLDSKGPVFYVSDRLGKRGRSFRCFKFRTMVPDAEARKKDLIGANERQGVLFKMRNDPRITRIGRFLRKYSIDEIPQFFNVLLGEMSLVGPRPPIPSEVAKYDLEHLHRLSVLPGITGLWQVKARKDASFERYIALDMSYVENWSPWLDMKILLRTVQVVLYGTGS